MSDPSVLVVGASLAGLRGAEALRRDGFGGEVTIVGAEPHLPYDRPPLSKQVLAGQWEPDRTALTTAADLEALDIEVQLGATAASLDLDDQSVGFEDGSSRRFDRLLIATGARCATLPFPAVQVLRSIDDALALEAAFAADPKRVVVIGAGFIGCEVASTARGRGLDVTVVEALDHPLERVVGSALGEVVGNLHRERGVDLRSSVRVERVETIGESHRVVLDDQSAIDADVVVAGVGVIANTEWLAGSGLDIDDGVVCDSTCLAAPGVAAAGDVARWHNELFDESMRVEHWDNAVAQGAHAARRLVADASEVTSFAPVPWFWSDQYDRKIQVAGRPRPDDEMRVVVGSVDEDRFVVVFGRDDRLTGVFGMNRARHVMGYRSMIQQRASFAEACRAEL